ncbi:MAG TPA: maltose alpha-D-glucosyltransferase [Vicinamibacterales bacterium]|nr:maltose alpha-D-glucosyltransferase [Vicinamibacterales bacterium]
MATDTPNLTLPADAVLPAPSAAQDDPLWYKDAIIYQAHVKSFFDSNNDGIGDFPGLTQKLDYLQSLGVTCVWLLPFFPSPLRDDGYDIADYENVHPSYGTLHDFEALVRAAHARNIKVLIELVVNHTSDQHPWFQRARRAPKGSPEREFYVWSDTDKKFAETRIIFLDTEKSNWAWDETAGQYYWHRFFSHQPDLNHNNPAVVDAVIGVMKFWLDRGVDALRLDAVPYLCVRDGTNNENLPETHAVLKRIRHELDAAYRNRMLLAEANQWPADVRPYFGDGDECHMAFHFPLMPRMFMALRQEDRHAITEILNQTPDIPETCQWALFLRNHDELTLEMVSDEERDYMYQMYAGDPQMRLNLGIRRRLAPLMENSRRRIELLNSLLFSMPGTPIVYYGDEIGMGDNIYLGDRNGVRTPMQWSPDRNAGFSRADPARLYAPPIQDPVYGYQSINVEAQERYPFSLLNWTKRLIATRKQHRVFGRGSLEFVSCPNRKVLAYLRRDDKETILVVSNLSRTVQPAALDLRSFAGLTPVEMGGLTEFPRIGDDPYFLTLGPYASYWFTLQQEPMQMAARVTTAPDPNAATLESLYSLLVGPDWTNVLDSGTRTVIERHALVPFLQRQRWFVARAPVHQARFTDWTPIRSAASPAFITIVSVEYTDGWTDAYCVPLALVSGDAAARALQSAATVVARITGARKGAIIDGLQDDEVCERLLTWALGEQEHATVRGSVKGSRQATAPPPAASPRTWRRVTGDHSNTLAFAGDELVVKLFRRMEPGVNPELEIGRTFAAQSFDRVPPLVAAMEYLRPSLEPGTLAVVQRAIGNQGTGWTYTIDELRRFFERVMARSTRHDGHDRLDGQEGRAGLEPPPFFAALESWYLASAGILGRRTAEMHVALAGGAGDAFAPEPLDAARLETLARDLRAHAVQALDRVADASASLDPAIRTLADAVLGARESLLARIDAIRGISDAGVRIRVHGDYHLGQVLRVEEDFLIVDFEGDPSLPLAVRREKQSPLRDVAGMLRSFSYAAYAALFAFTLHAPDQFEPLESWAETWRHWVVRAFWRGYADALGPSPLLPATAATETLLRAFTIDKALHELRYELKNRPEWVRIPLMGLQKLIER